MKFAGQPLRSWLFILFFGGLFVDATGEAFQLFAAEHGVVDHAEQELLGGAAAEAVDNGFYGADGDALAGIGGAINKGAAVEHVGEISLFLETAEDRANGRVLHGAGGGEGLAAGFGRGWSVGPDVVHDSLFDFSQIL